MTIPQKHNPTSELIVTFNVGSATLKIGVYRHTPDNSPPFLFSVNIDLKTQQCHWHGQQPIGFEGLDVTNAKTAALSFLQLLTPLYMQDKFVFIHRVVHGGERFSACLLTIDIIAELHALAHLVPLHQPPALAIIDTINETFTQHEFIQVAAFDTAFHAKRPRLWAEYALPLKIREQGVKSYGFHGLSYQSIMRQLTEFDKNFAQKRLIISHLGSGCSVTSVKNGQTVDSTLGFSGLDGVPMGTRCGSIDSGVVIYMLEQGWDYPQIVDCLYKQSGLLGLSGVSNDVRELQNSSDPQAQFALTHFTAHVAKAIAGLVTSLQGLDGLIFTGGIGENADTIRQAIGEQLGWLGVNIDMDKNEQGLQGENLVDITANNSPIKVFIMATDEQYELYQAGLHHIIS